MSAGEGRVIRISVRELVEFVMKSGDIDNRRTSGAERDAMQAGSRIHRKIQRSMGTGYQAEVVLKRVVEQSRYQLLLEGRADGILSENGEVVIDEIKGVYLDIFALEEPLALHLAQALCYGAMYCHQYGLEAIGIQVTYCSLETEQIRRFRQDWKSEELEAWFEGLIHEYVKWADYLYFHGLKRDRSLGELVFPFPYRAGQRELAIAVYRAICRETQLFIQAPTGVGKTLSVVFPALKAMGEGKGEKLFYLTAKTVTRTVAEHCFSLLRERGLFFTAVTLTAKEKLCPMEKPECNPDACSLAKGHFDRVRDAVFEVIHQETAITRKVVLEYAQRFQVCPFEFCLDISSWADGIICDYNYVFDPSARLRRYFGEGGGDYLFLVDEAHNLVGRAREMFGAVLVKEEILEVKRLLKTRAVKAAKKLEQCNKSLLALKREAESEVLEELGALAGQLQAAYTELELLLEEQREFPERERVLEFYFSLRHFLHMYEQIGEDYRIYTELLEDGRFLCRLLCVDPSRHLGEVLKQGRSTVFFSATLLPVQYYRRLLSGERESYAVYAPSPFLEENRLLLVGTDVSSRYSRRNSGEYQKIVDYIQALAESHCGNYLVFFPSYPYLEAVRGELPERIKERFAWKIQTSHMTEKEREEFLAAFEQEPSRSLIGLCVLGGIFSEGIDLKDKRLEGVIVVGTGLPMVCREQELLRGYFEERGEDGYNYAYQYPGMNKVMQAAGRVIRTATDRGVILLLDDRFLKPQLQAMFPMEWSGYGKVTRKSVRGWLWRFWSGEAPKPADQSISMN